MQRTPRMTVMLMAVSLLSSATGTAATYYVDNSHINADDGWPLGANSQSWPWETIAHAASVISPNDTVYVKQTSTAYAPFVVADDNVSFIGYKTTPGDRDGGTGIPTSYSNVGSQSGQLPVIDGQDRTSGTGIDFGGHDNVTVMNFHVTGCRYAVVLYLSSYCTVENIFAWDLGDLSASYSGYGILINGHEDHRTYPSDLSKQAKENDIVNCVVLNAGAQAVTISRGKLNTVEDCRVYADDNSTGKKSATDYYYVIADGDDNDILSCVAERQLDPGHDDLEHGGHGFVVQAVTDDGEAGTGNVFDDCEAYDIDEPFVLRGMVTQNEFWDCYAEIFSDNDPYANGDITLYSGPHDNEFHNVRLHNVDVAIGVFGGPYDPNANTAESAASSNLFVNCIFECELAFDLSDYEDEDGTDLGDDDLSDGETLQDFNDNGFLHCNFIGDPLNGDNVFFRSAREADGNQLVNCIVYGFDTFVVGSTVSGNQPYTPLQSSPGFSFDWTCLYNPGSDFPAAGSLGSNNVTGDPAFQDFVDFEIGSSSSCRDVGVYAGVTLDVDGDTRDANPDIGAQEY